METASGEKTASPAGGMAIEISRGVAEAARSGVVRAVELVDGSERSSQLEHQQPIVVASSSY